MNVQECGHETKHCCTKCKKCFACCACDKGTTPQAARPAKPTNFQWYSVCSRHIEFTSTCSACLAGEWINADYHELEQWLYENDKELWKKWANLPKNKAFLESVFPGLRAVAPVETPDEQDCTCANVHTDMPCSVHEASAVAPVETRLTAEPTIAETERLIRKIEACEGMPAKLILMRHFAEAFRDKSESGLRKRIERLTEDSEVEGWDLWAAEIKNAGLREEIERLKRETEEAKELLREARPRTPQKKWHESVKALLLRKKTPSGRDKHQEEVERLHFKVSSKEMDLESREEQLSRAAEELTELRAKLAEQVKGLDWYIANGKRISAETTAAGVIPVNKDGKIVLVNTLAEAAEAEVAALRERERWIPVEEKLPEVSSEGESDIILALSATGTPHIAYMSDKSWTWYEYWQDKRIAKPTHWKALSAAPERPTTSTADSG